MTSTEYGDLALNDYGIVNDFRGSWQDQVPPDNDFELGWLGVESSWLFESDDDKIWFHVDDDPNSNFPPFDANSTWFNRDDTAETIDLYMTCSNVYNDTPAPSPEDSSCECIQVATDGLSAIDGVYELANDTLNDGANYYRPRDDMRYFVLSLSLNAVYAEPARP